MNKLILSFIIALFIHNTGFSQVAVIANNSVPVEKISNTEVLDFYTGDVRTWEDGQAVTVFDLKPKGAVKKTFYDFIGKTASRMKSIWMRNLLSGEGDPPESLVSENEMIEKVIATPGAIGFVSKDRAGPEVKVLATIDFVVDD